MHRPVAKSLPRRFFGTFNTIFQAPTQEPRPLVLVGAHDGTNRVFVGTQYGTIHVWPNDANASKIQTFLDIRDRVVKGYDQRWAYVTVASNITENTSKFGRSEKATDEIVQSFITQLFPKITKPTALQVAAKGE